MTILPRLIVVLAAVLAVGWADYASAQATGQLFKGFSGKSKDPVHIDAKTLEIYEEGKQRVSVFSGNVTVKRGDTILKATTIKLYSDLTKKTATDDDQFTKIEMDGTVYVNSGTQTVTGQSAVVDMKTQTITMIGDVVLSQGKNVITGSRLVVNMETGHATVEQAPGKRIQGIFTPGAIKKKPGAPAATPAPSQ